MRKLINAIFVAAGLLFTANIANAQQKIGHLNSEAIFAVMPEAKVAQTTLEAFNKTKTAEIEKMQGEYQTKYAAAVAKQKTISEANKEAVGKELDQMGAELEDLKKRINDAGVKAQQEFAQKQGDLFVPINTKFEAAVKSVAKEKGLAYVFDIAAQQNGNNLLFSEGGDDITAAVRTKLGIAASAVPATAPAAAPKK
ncbi:OmpH family outer membrane protein [Pedobacter duraquae]|uniref:Periplasmic chaperone for outer membrane proteins Skp n=1 Tax=Pedobacter duraquae TaxID=425511 RepID=A0A4R6IJ63_9SPHI|nr:OmpH family outer membrane protein [Pedobacter duraquae]TDO22049.1 periplasmic chaperone for outer membrane proteins Skp [Pedobacter duraquae]